MPPIPDHQFVRLKHRHHVKRKLSQFAELNRRVPYSILVFVYYGGGVVKSAPKWVVEARRIHRE